MSRTWTRAQLHAVADVPFGTFVGSGVTVDPMNRVWAPTSDPGPLLRFNPTTNAADTLDGPNRVYTYTDFTGAVRRLVIGTGTHTELFSACDRALWAELRWDTNLPPGTSLVFNVQFAHTMVGLGSAMPIALATTTRDTSPVDIQSKLRMLGMPNPGRYARLTVTFNPTNMPVASPVLRSVSLGWRCSGEG